MASRKNGDIRGFFKSGPGPSSSQPPASPPSLTPDLLSSPRTPKTAPRVFRRDEVIKGSDESGDDDDSDDSLGSITNALGYRTRPAAHQRDPSVLSTPQAKRIASGNIHRSPLTLQPKKHKFDLKALLSHSREIERTEESVRRADALLAEAEQNSGNSDNSDTDNDAKRAEEVASHILVGSDDEGGKGDKVRRAFKRSKDSEASSRKHCYFFTQEEPSSNSSKNAFPRKATKGLWKCLSKAATRRQAFLMGLPYTLLAKGEELPDELFQWILDEICTEQNPELRRQYINLAELCVDHTHRLIDDMRLYALLEAVGGPKYAREHSKFRSTTEVRQEYLERDWSPVTVFLQLLERIAPSLQIAAAISAVQLLLRMSLDPVVAAVVRECHVQAMTILVSSLAKSRSQWNTACDAICSYIYENISDLELKLTALSSIPSSSLHLVDLRRRIAAESLFDKPGLGRRPIDPYLSFERIRDRLDADDFKPTNKPDFDFERLRALTTLMDIVIDSADFMRQPGTTNGTSTNPNGTTSTTTPATKPRITTPDKKEQEKDTAAAEQKFNAEIDILATRVKVIHDKIRDKASRKNVKLSLLGLEKRLKYAVRTQPPPRRDIFALDSNSNSITTQQSDENVPKQRDFMRQWAQKKKEEKEEKEEERKKEEGVGRKEEVDEGKGETRRGNRENSVDGGRRRRRRSRGRPRRAANNVQVAVG
ncbi:hypothetical protein F4678DRAFT_431080 [Xylaria arbuscula]|nr:hypothetical protein F4678DRAFT_431080 [Xylaria arbuscula]